MKILFVIGQYHPVIGGAEIQAKRLASALAQRNINISVLTSYVDGEAEEELIDGVCVKRIKSFGFGRIKILLLALKFIFEIIRHYKDFDLIHVHQANQYAFAAVIAAKFLKKKIIIKCSNSEDKFDLRMLVSNFPMLNIGSLMCKTIVKNASYFIALNKDIKTDLNKFGVENENIVEIGNGVSLPDNIWPDNQKEARQSLNVTRDGFIGVCVAGLKGNKNHSFLLDEVKKLKDKINFKLYFVGDGPMMNKLLHKISELDLNDTVFISGWVNNVSTYLAAADFFVLPSFMEGISNALLEAMATGIPCIVSNVPGNRSLILDGDNGILIDFKKPDSFNKAIFKIKNDSNLRIKLGLNGRKYIEKNYCLDTIVQHYIDLYKMICSNTIIQDIGTKK